MIPDNQQKLELWVALPTPPGSTKVDWEIEGAKMKKDGWTVTVANQQTFTVQVF